MTYHIEHNLPIEQLNPVAQREVKVKRALNVPGAFWGRSIKAENIGQSSDDLAAPNQTLTFDPLCGTIAL